MYLKTGNRNDFQKCIDLSYVFEDLLYKILKFEEMKMPHSLNFFKTLFKNHYLSNVNL